MGRRRTPPDVISVETQEQITEICGQCRNEGRFAFDTEFVMEDRFETDVCLLQIATASSTAIIDPLLEVDLEPIWSLVSDPEVETVVHAGQEDLALCVQHTGKTPQRIYDVQIAAGFAGYSYPLSLQKLVQATLHVGLHKSKTLTDWRKRPLTNEQVRYAAEDVCYLLAVRKMLHETLSRQDRIDWARQEFARFEDISLYKRVEEEKLLRLRGSGALKGRQLAILRELQTWREAFAKRFDRPVRAMLKDHLLVEIAKLELCDFTEIRDLRGLTLSDKQVRSISQAVETARKTPPEQWPKLAPRDTETAKEAALIALMTGVIRSFCLEHDLAYGLVATKKSIHDLLRYCTSNQRTSRSEVELLNGWREQTVGTLLMEILEGKRTISVEQDGEGPVVRIN